MGIKDFLYRCPFCGHDPMEGKGAEAQCPQCSRVYSPGKRRSRFRVEGPPGEEPFEVPGAELARRIDAFGGPLSRARAPDGEVRYRSEVTARFSSHEEPVRYRGGLLGFVERYEDPVGGWLELEGRRLRFRPRKGSGVREWGILDLRAVQASSSSVQVSPPEGGIVAFRFRRESARRWEELLKWTLRDAWQELGKGEIIEFQPRICAR